MGGGGGDNSRNFGEENSDWIMRNIQKFSHMLGVSFNRLEDQVVDFFMEIERRRNGKLEREW